jgi:hypothetical protein
VGSKTSKAPYDLTAHFERYGNAFDDGQTIQTRRVMEALPTWLVGLDGVRRGDATNE